MKEYRDQMQRWWDMEKRHDRATKAGMWLEAVSLEYILLELRLRLLLRTKQIGREIIDAKKYLVQLVDFEETHQFIDSSLAERIRDFNQIRKDAIHGLI